FNSSAAIPLGSLDVVLKPLGSVINDKAIWIGCKCGLNWWIKLLGANWLEVRLGLVMAYGVVTYHGPGMLHGLKLHHGMVRSVWLLIDKKQVVSVGRYSRVEDEFKFGGVSCRKAVSSKLRMLISPDDPIKGKKFSKTSMSSDKNS
ncbi:hypothetical protein Tco_0106895, partial [Tanacetum coccineum]